MTRMRPSAAASTPARWSLLPCDTNRAKTLSANLRVHPAVGRLLAARGWDPGADCDAFLSPALRSLRDPFELKDMDRAVERTLRAIRNNEPICVFGDYDVDGVCSTAIAVLALRRLGADPAAFIPHRVDDGYGMHAAQVERLAAEGIRLIVTVDNGTSAAAEIARAAELGVDVVVTDHHLPSPAAGEAETNGADLLPHAVAVVNPNRPDAFYTGGRLCGAGVAFKFAHALLRGAGADAEESRVFLRELLDLAALGTIADVVPLLGENRVLARHGLDALMHTRRPGLRALMDVTRLSGKPLNSQSVGFVIGPRLNAAGRTEHGRTALELLLTPDWDRALELARYLDMLNRRRRDEELVMLKDSLERAEEQIEGGLDSLLVVAGEDYHLGIVGIVAARLAERYHRPSIVLRLDNDMAKGSARSIPGFDIHQALGACCGRLAGWGGHAAAAGLQIDPSLLDCFRSEINAFAAEVFESRDLSPEVAVDAEIAPGEVSWDLYHDTQRLQPFGQDNPAPVFLMRGVRAGRPPRIVGTDHLKMDLQTGAGNVPAIGFNMGKHLAMVSDGTFDVLFRPTENVWRGNRTLEFELQDVRPA